MKKSFNTCDITSASSENSNAARENRNSEVNPVQIANTTTSSSENAGTARRNRESEDISAQNTDITSSASENSNAARLNCAPEIKSVQYTTSIPSSENSFAVRISRDPEDNSVENIDLVPSFENKCGVRLIRDSEGNAAVEVPISKRGEGEINVKYSPQKLTVSARAASNGRHNELSATINTTDGSIDFDGHSTPTYQSREERNRIMSNMRDRGLTQKVIAQRLNVSQQLVSYVLKKEKDTME